MAYMNQERKAERMPAIKAALKKYGMKGSVAVRNHMTLVVNIKSGDIDFSEFGDHYQVNPYRIEVDYHGAARDFLLELKAAMLGHDYFDESDSMTDYFHCSHYIDINLGSWNKPYILHSTEAA
jgi:hypothetical protein